MGKILFLVGILLFILSNRLEDRASIKSSQVCLWSGLALIVISFILLR